jgi:thiol-disulfide isomerase/thioredoxin|uniref:Thioredoxin domain-containing protein n=1 Tax=viral metagenome TaxID=1070528 RepID=A0A6C0HEZ5_9ZZZZ
MRVGGKIRKYMPRSVMGRLLPPVDVTNESMLSELDKRISIGPVTLVFVYADWCGHCQRFKPEMEKLENLPGRSVQIARVRDDMLPKSSLNTTKIAGYPSLLLIKKSGEPTTFKDESGEVSNVVPDHGDMNKMATLVRNAGKEEGVSILEQGQNIVTDRLSQSNVSALNTTLKNSKNRNIQKSTGPAVMAGGGLVGGGLWSHLYAASQNIAPAAVLLLGAVAVSKKSRSRKTRKQQK